MVMPGATWWVAEQLARLRGASLAHLRTVATVETGAPSATTIRMALRHLMGMSGAPALVEAVKRPCGEDGLVLSDIGLEVLSGARDWASADDVEHKFAPTGVHEQWICDLAVVWGTRAKVMTEFEVERAGTKGRRPDLWVLDGDFCWAVEVETSIKGTGDNKTRYEELAATQATGEFVGPFGEPDAVLYLANTGFERHRRGIAEAVVSGVFDPDLADVEHDMVLVVDPVGLDAIAVRPFHRRKQAVEKLVGEARSVLRAVVGQPIVELTTGYVTPTMRERPPGRVLERSVVAIGALIERSGERGVLECRGVHWRLRNLPSEMSIPVEGGMRLVVFGEMSSAGVLRVEHVRALGFAWEPSARRLAAQRRREEMEAEQAHFDEPF